MKTIFTFSFFLTLSTFIQAQDEGFIYGKVTTIDNRVFEGPIRWGKEEVLWTDLFNAAKVENENLRYLSRDDMDYLEDLQYRSNHSWGGRWVSQWVNYDFDDRRDFTHQFVCQFGEIKSIKPSWRNSADIVMRNGKKMEVSGEGYNDVGGSVQVKDREVGTISLDWGRIELIEFVNTPSKLKDKFDNVIYGTVETSKGRFKGPVAWDNDERLLSDKLDGRTDDGKVSIEFGNIASIGQRWDEAMVELKSGRTMSMCCTNDVNQGNRGIVVIDEKMGMVKVPWREFKKLTLSQPEKLKGYDDFKDQKELSGTVTTSEGKTLDGKIIYDLDEAFAYEILQGKESDIEFFIPFRNLKSISPNGWRGAEVELDNGTKLRLEEGQDVSEKHSGILVFSGKTEPSYVHWEDVKEIKFK